MAAVMVATFLNNSPIIASGQRTDKCCFTDWNRDRRIQEPKAKKPAQGGVLDDWRWAQSQANLSQLEIPVNREIYRDFLNLLLTLSSPNLSNASTGVGLQFFVDIYAEN